MSRCRHGSLNECGLCEDLGERNRDGTEERHEIESDPRGSLAERRYERWAAGE